jgi:hypothetical protein
MIREHREGNERRLDVGSKMPTSSCTRMMLGIAPGVEPGGTPEGEKWSGRQDSDARDRLPALKDGSLADPKNRRSCRCYPRVTPELEKWSGRLDSNQRPLRPSATSCDYEQLSASTEAPSH